MRISPHLMFDMPGTSKVTKISTLIAWLAVCFLAAAVGAAASLQADAFYAELGITMGTENPERTPGSGQGGGNGGDPAARQATQAAAEALGTPVGTGSSSGQDRKNALTEAVIEALLAIVNN